ncbi:hypothetical protein RB195_002866 [Necator americanus]|uniref:Ligand-binding domain of nuclear hormone receptor n=1 Tax=Necator americanus TaxID=51031 RepID=A0ABR1DNV7_NECAM
MDEPKTVVIDSEDDDGQGSSAGEVCGVCGAEKAAMHYGAIACVGCKGFFRRALMKADQLECQANGNCPIRVDLRTQCRSCRFQKCLEAGMKPEACRPNRDYTGKQRKKTLTKESTECLPQPKNKGDWMKKLTVEMRTLLMNLLNIEAKVMKGDTNMDASQLYPLGLNTIREIIDDPSKLKGKRSEMRYEPFRMAKNNELSSVAYRRLIAAIDWVEHLAPLMGGLDVEDKIALVKNAFAPLMVFKFASRTAEVAKDENILCLCNFAYVPRNISQAFSDSYHLGNGLVGRALDELVRPYRAYGMREEEIVCVSAMIVLNPLARDLSPEAFEKILEMRNKIEDTLYMIVKEARSSQQPAICFGHILLSLPIVTVLANTMCENLQFAQVFSNTGEIPLLTDLFGCFPVEPFSEEENAKEMGSLSIGKEKSPKTMCDKETQTEHVAFVSKVRMKRPYFMTNPVDDEPQHFKLLQPPGNYTLTEMFDDLRCIGQDSPLSHGSPSTSSQQATMPPPLVSSSQTNGCAEYPPQLFPQTPTYANNYVFPSTASNGHYLLTRTYSNPATSPSTYQQVSQPISSHFTPYSCPQQLPQYPNNWRDYNV